MIDLNGLKLKNRFVIASGALEYGRGWPWERPLIKLGLIKPSLFGAIITKTLTLEPHNGNFIDPFEFEHRSLPLHLWHIINKHDSAMKRVLRRVPNGWINSLAWWNVGFKYWTNEIFPEVRHLPLIVSIGGFAEEEYIQLIQQLNALYVLGVELNISCPSIKNSFLDELFWDSNLKRFLTKCRENSEHHLILKLGADRHIVEKAKIAKRCGINVLSLINTVPVFGEGWSGPGIKPIALRTVAQVKNKVKKIFIIGGGGIESWSDCHDFLVAGADAVSFGSVHFARPWKPTQIVRKYHKI